MINLLPASEKKQLKASIDNSSLIKFVFFFLAILMTLILSVGFIYLNLIQSKKELEIKLEEVTRNSQKHNQTKQEAETLNSSLSKVDQVLKSKNNYSSLLIKLADILPSGSNINTLTINDKLSSSKHPIQILADNRDTVAKVKQNLEQSPIIASSSIVSLHKDGEHSYSILINLTFNPKELEKILKWKKPLTFRQLSSEPFW